MDELLFLLLSLKKDNARIKDIPPSDHSQCSLLYGQREVEGRGLCDVER